MNGHGDLISRLEARRDPLSIEAARMIRALTKDAVDYAIYGRLTVYFCNRDVEIDGNPVHLSKTERAIVQALAKKKYAWVETERLLFVVWDSTVEPNTLRVNIFNIRKKLRLFLGYSCIDGSPRSGYRLLECYERSAAA